MNRFRFVPPSKLPQLPYNSDDDYLRKLSAALEDWYRNFVGAVREIDNPPLLSARLASNQSVSNNTLTTVAFDTVIDARGWWSANTYTPQEAGYYRCSWGVTFHDTAAIATSTYGYAYVDSTATSIAYGNGTALDIGTVTGCEIVKCNGSTDPLKLQALILTGTAPVLFANRCWLDISYIGGALNG